MPVIETTSGGVHLAEEGLAYAGCSKPLGLGDSTLGGAFNPLFLGA